MMKAPLKPTTGSPEHDAFVRRMSLVFIGAAFFVMTSQNVMAPNLTAVADSFGLDSAGRDTILGGWMSTAFFLIGGPMSVVVGYLVDVSNRKDLFLSVMFLGNAVILLNAVASTIWQLVVLRALLGAVLGGVLPLLYSIFGDLFPPARRSTVSALVGTASGAGVLIGQVLSGLVGSSYGWRSPYVLISMLGFGAMYLVKVFGEEPARGTCFWIPLGVAVRGSADVWLRPLRRAHAPNCDFRICVLHFLCLELDPRSCRCVAARIRHLFPLRSPYHPKHCLYVCARAQAWRRTLSQSLARVSRQAPR